MVHPSISKHTSKVRLSQDATLWARREQRALQALEDVRDASTPSQLLKLKSERDACRSDLVAERQNVQHLNRELEQLRTFVKKLSSKDRAIDGALIQTGAQSNEARRAFETEKGKIAALESKIRLLEKELAERNREPSTRLTWAQHAAGCSPDPPTLNGTTATDTSAARLEEMRRATEELEAQLKASEERLEAAEVWVSHYKSESKVTFAAEKELENELAASIERIEDLKHTCSAFDAKEKAAAFRAAKVATSHALELSSLQAQAEKADRERREVLARFTPPPSAIRPARNDCLIRALGFTEEQLVACIDLWELSYGSLIPRLMWSTLREIDEFETRTKEWEKAAEVELVECRLKLAAYEAEAKNRSPTPPTPAIRGGKGTEQALRKRCAVLESGIRLLRVELEKRKKDTVVVRGASSPPKKTHTSIGTQTSLILPEPTSAAQSVAVKRLASNVARLNEVITSLRSENTSLLLQLAGVQ